jgi:hypothetical protein
MDSVGSQIMTLIHKVDILYQMIEQLNRKIALLGTESGCTNHHSVSASQFDVRISDYYVNGEIIGACEASENLSSDGASWPSSDRRKNSRPKGKTLASSLKEVNALSPVGSSPLSLEDEACYPSGERHSGSLVHHDVLRNEDHLEDMIQGDTPLMTEDIQIQRLTAQLTAAYNRIAALEEQLVANRIHA